MRFTNLPRRRWCRSCRYNSFTIRTVGRLHLKKKFGAFVVICVYPVSVISIYFLLVIRSYYYKMDDRKPAVYNTA